MKEEEKIEATDQTGKKYNYWPLVLPVMVTAIVAIGVYVNNFWGLPPSRKPSDWAAFATYVSGTVGVAAVVATLMAFVITLKQQKKLIDSQSDMIIKQEQQLDLTRQQLEGEERRRKVELVYNCAVNIIPPVVKELERQRVMRSDYFFDGFDLVQEVPPDVNIHQTVGELFSDGGEYSWLDQLDKGWLICFGEALTGNAYRLGVLVSDCLYEAKELEDYFRSVIGSDNFSMIECAMLFKKNSVNSGFSRHQRALRIVDGKQSNPAAQFWHDLGEKAFEKPTE
ncbi:hypothetical protein [Halomonas sp. G11]|uniref:hypothetical protein n=1 Tax=Halomonas sp. G11 TaxID=1684425 RepID=UPI0007FCEE34|nr:hypothetical protein [Halomonas sp. G11]OAZ99749.1 hypothetical protein ADS46_13165 [Halomonas sp. G11]